MVRLTVATCDTSAIETEFNVKILDADVMYKLIETTLHADVGESASIDYAPAGLVCRFSAPLAGFEEKAEPRAVR